MHPPRNLGSRRVPSERQEPNGGGNTQKPHAGVMVPPADEISLTCLRNPSERSLREFDLLSSLGREIERESPTHLRAAGLTWGSLSD